MKANELEIEFNDLISFPEVILKNKKFIDITKVIRKGYNRKLRHIGVIRDKRDIKMFKATKKSRHLLNPKTLDLAKEILNNQIDKISVYYRGGDFYLIFNGIDSEDDIIDYQCKSYGFREARWNKHSRFNRVIKSNRKEFNHLVKEFRFNCVNNDYERFIKQFMDNLGGFAIIGKIYFPDFTFPPPTLELSFRYHGFSNLYVDIDFRIENVLDLEYYDLKHKNKDLEERIKHLQKDIEDYQKKIQLQLFAKLKGKFIHYKLRLYKDRSSYSSWHLRNRLCSIPYPKAIKLIKGDPKHTLQSLGVIDNVGNYKRWKLGR
jgi:hypothetical protein